MKMVSHVDAGTLVSGFEDVDNQLVNVDESLISAMTTQQYSDGPYAAMRELVTNAAESHVQAGKADVPFDVSLDYDPSVPREERVVRFTIRDYGVGMSPRFVEGYRDESGRPMGYYVVGHSTKRSDENVGGSFGLGAKAVFAVTAVAEVTTYYNGIAYDYLVGLHAGYIRVKRVNQQPSDEPTGVRISFTFPPTDHPSEDVVSNLEGLYVLKDGDPSDIYSQSEFNEAISEGAKESRRPPTDFSQIAWLPINVCNGLVDRFFRTMLPVGHPGSTYRTSPRITINDLPVKLKPWQAEHVGSFVTKFGITGDQYPGQPRYCELSAMAVIARDAYMAAPYEAISKTDAEGYLNRLHFFKRTHWNSSISISVLFWHNAIYSFDKVTGGYTSGPKLVTGNANRIKYLSSAPDMYYSYAPMSHSTVEMFFVPAGISLPVTPERSAIRDTEESRKELSQLFEAAERATKSQLAAWWLEEFDKLSAELNEQENELDDDGYGPNPPDQPLARIDSSHKLQAMLRALWGQMFHGCVAEFPEDRRAEFAFGNLSDYVLNLVIGSLVKRLQEKPQARYELVLARSNRAGSVQVNTIATISQGIAEDGGPVVTRANQSRLWRGGIVWESWTFVDNLEAIKIKARDSSSTICACLSADYEAFGSLKQTLRGRGIRVIDATTVHVPTKIRETGKYRHIQYYTREYQGNFEAGQNSLRHIQSYGWPNLYAITGSKSGLLQIPGSAEEISEHELLKDVERFFGITIPRMAVIRKSDPAKTVKIFEEAGLVHWPRVFQDYLGDSYLAWRKKVFLGKMRSWGTEVSMFSRLLTAATESEDPKQWCKFLGWKPARLERQLWYRIHTRLDKEWRDRDIPDLFTWSQRTYAGAIFDKRTLYRISRAHSESVLSTAFLRRHEHELPGADDRRALVSTVEALWKSQSANYFAGKPREQQFIRELARSYVENFSTP